MAIDPRRRQKKLEKKKAKEKAKQKELARRSTHDLLARLGRVAPVLHSLVYRDIWESGLGVVLLSRQTTGGNVAFAAFLVDVYCLGVKSVICDVQAAADYRQRIGESSFGRDLQSHPPEYCRKLVESAVEYARDLGFEPPHDYSKARLLFGDIDAAACHETFEFGHEGKPLFVAGPGDNAARSKWILAMLEERLGPGGFDFLLPVGSTSFKSEHLHDLDEADDENFDDQSEYDSIADSAARDVDPRLLPP